MIKKFLNAKLFRKQPKVVESPNGTKRWHLNDKLHREDGRAVEKADGHKKWYLNGEELTEEEHIQVLKQLIYQERQAK